MTAPALRLAIAASLCIGAGATLAGPLRAQTEIAVPVARGTLRFDITPFWLSYDHRFGLGVPGYADGAPVPINLDFEAESLGVQSLPFLRGLQSNIQAAADLGGFSLNLGHTTTVMNASVRTIPIGLEYGLTSRLAIGVTVPIVRSRVDVNFAVDTTTGKRSNVAFAEPRLGLAVPDAGRRRHRRPAAAGRQRTVVAARTRPGPALARLQPFQYLAHALLLPVGSTDAGDSVALHLSGAETAYGNLAAQYASNGVTLPPLNKACPCPTARRPATTSSASSRTRRSRWRGHDRHDRPHRNRRHHRSRDVPVRRRAAVPRPGAGHDAVPHRRHAVPEQLPGSRHGDPPVRGGRRARNDVLLGSSFLVHAVARIGGARADDIERRVTPPDLPFATDRPAGHGPPQAGRLVRRRGGARSGCSTMRSRCG